MFEATERLRQRSLRRLHDQEIKSTQPLMLVRSSSVNGKVKHYQVQRGEGQPAALTPARQKGPGDGLRIETMLGNQPSNEWSVPFVSTIARKPLRRTMAKTKGTTKRSPPKKCYNFHRADGTYYLTFKDI